MATVCPSGHDAGQLIQQSYSSSSPPASPSSSATSPSFRSFGSTSSPRISPAFPSPVSTPAPSSPTSPSLPPPRSCFASLSSCPAPCPLFPSLAPRFRGLVTPFTLRLLRLSSLLYHLALLPLLLYLLTLRPTSFLPPALSYLLVSLLLLRSLLSLSLHALLRYPAVYYGRPYSRRIRTSLRLTTAALLIPALASMDMTQPFDFALHAWVGITLTFGLVMTELFLTVLTALVWGVLAAVFEREQVSLVPPFIEGAGGEDGEGKKKEAGGLTLEMMQRVPALAYRAGLKCDPLCAICYAEFEEGERMRLFTCNHGYHADCIDEWLVRRRTCPLCVSIVKLPAVVGLVETTVEISVGE